MSNNLPVEVKKGFNKLTYSKKEKIKGVAKLIGYAGLIPVGMGLTIIGGGLATGLGFISMTTGISNLLFSSRFKSSNDSLFVTTRGRKKSKISQQSFGIQESIIRLRIKETFKGDEDPRTTKAALMTLQTLVMLQREKQELYIKRKGIDENRLYSKKYEIKTHGINIKNMKLLEDLGYLTIDEDIVENNSLLIMERIGFGQLKEARKAIKAKITGNKDAQKVLQKKMHKLSFRITDKPINFQELYDLCNNSNEKGKISRFKAIFDKKRGILAKFNLDVQTDEEGFSRIIYNANEPFVRRIEEQKGEEQHSEIQEFRERLDAKDYVLDSKKRKKVGQSSIQLTTDNKDYDKNKDR